MSNDFETRFARGLDDEFYIAEKSDGELEDEETEDGAVDDAALEDEEEEEGD